MRSRVQVANPSDGGLLYWLLRYYAFAVAALFMAVIWTGFGVYIYFAKQLPPIPDLSSYARTTPGVTTLVAQDGTVIGELATERRAVVPFDKIPPQLINAFVAIEDRRFFTHGGVDMRGMARAFVTNWKKGGVTQGGSTITQQVAKSFLSSERTFSRKIREAIFARRLEARYDKREILSLYLNHIFLGNKAFGVQAAAQRYFDRPVWELSLPEMAMLAGLARAPSRDDPLIDAEAATARRGKVLDAMVEAGYVTRAEADKAKTEPLRLVLPKDQFHAVTPYFAEHVRRDLVKRFGNKSVYEGGWRVETTVLPFVDVAARENVDAATRKLDKRQGWRGAEARLDEHKASVFRKRAEELYGSAPLEEDKLYLGLVERVTAELATVRVGAKTYPLPLANMSWAAPFTSKDGINDKTIETVGAALKKGDVIWVKNAFHAHTRRFSEFTYDELGESAWLQESTKKTPRTVELTLEQTPRVSGAVYTFDHRDGYTLAMAGGDDFDRSEFNRVTQACRQPGSAYKPIYYSLALDRGYDFLTQWNDKPKAEVDPDTGELYLPKNVDGTYDVRVSLERALVWSKNPPSVEIFHILSPKGSTPVENWAHKLGIVSPLISPPRKPGERDCAKEFCSALALGSSCVKIDEVTRAFSVFARNGRPIEPITIRRILDRDGKVLEDHTRLDDPWLPPSARLDRIAAVAGDKPAPIIEPRTAWLTSKLLREIVTTGHSQPIRATKILSAGKTGTSSHTWDVWFIGYTSRWMSTVWLGDELHQRPLGDKDASFMLSVPMWARYMYQVSADQPLDEIPWERPPGVLKANDIGGPLKEQYPPPPEPGFGIDGKPLELPTKLKGQPIQTGPAPANLVPQRTVRVPTATPKPDAPPKSGKVLP
jgi:penicillin-binding protein 1A